MDSKSTRNTIAAYERGYRVTEDGLVLSPHGRVRKCRVNTPGFYSFSFVRADGERVHCHPHKLAAYQVYGELILSDLIITFRNNDRNDVRPSNIVLTTRADAAKGYHGQLLRLAYACNAARKLRKLSAPQLAEFRAMRDAGASLTKLSEHFSIAKSTASYIANRKTYA